MNSGPAGSVAAEGTKGEATDVVLEVRELHTRFLTPRGPVHAVRGVSFTLLRGQALALVGESGCGKSATVLSMLRLLPGRSTEVTAAAVTFLGQDLPSLGDEALRRVLGPDIGMVFQDPRSSLNPVLSIGRQVTESLEIHLGMTPADARSKSVELLQAVGVPDAEARLDDYPHQFSGGMCQRVMIAVALACRPSLLIADEPTTALDVTIQAQILRLVMAQRVARQMAVIWISHDLTVVAQVADWVAVMYAGVIVEYASAALVLGSPGHPYTLALLASVPPRDGSGSGPLQAIPGQPPDMSREIVGCAFAERCPHVFDRCSRERPPLAEVGAGQRVACWWDVGAGRERDAR